MPGNSSSSPSFALAGLLGSRSMPALPAVKGLGLALSPVSMSPTRAYGSDGEVFAQTWLMTTDLMFWSGMVGGVIFRRNLIVLLLCTEVVMLACNMNFLFGAAYLNDMTGKGPGVWEFRVQGSGFT